MTGQSGRAKPRVVIIGGGFGGLFAARALRAGPFKVTLIDRSPHHVFQPLLYQCATGILSEGQISAPLRGLLRRHRNIRCIAAEAIDVDPVGSAGKAEFTACDWGLAFAVSKTTFCVLEFSRTRKGLFQLPVQFP